jgi:hypothetical protein
VLLVNLTPEGRTSFVLPPLELPLQFFLRDEEDMVEARGVVDTLAFEPDLRRFSVVWRASHPLKREIFEVEEVVTGTMPRGWYRARELGKEYAPSLHEAIHRFELDGDEA